MNSKTIIFTISILLSINVFSQFSTMFNDTLKPFGDGGYVFTGIAQDDSFYYALGGVNNNEPLWNNMIIKYDKDFNIVNKRKYIDTNWYNAIYPYNSITVNKNQLLFCTQMSKNQMSIIYGKIVALNKQTLDTLWTRVIAHPDTAYVNLPNAIVFSDLTAIKQTPDNGYILTGNYNLQCTGANKRSFLLKIDSIGNVEWRKTYANISYLYDIELTPNGGYIFLNKDWGPIVIETDSLGNILWQKKINTLTVHATASDFSYAGNNSFVGAVKYLKTNSNSEFGLNIFKINLSNKTIMWQKKYNLYQTVECLGLHQAIGVETLSDGSIIVNGTVEKYGADKIGFILKLNSDGDSLWTKTYNFSTYNTGIHQLNDILICDDGGFLGVGFYKPPNGLVAWIFKTDSNGVVGWESSPPLNSKKIKAWPNPASEFVNIEIKERLKRDGDIIIYNSLGMKVKKVSVISGKTNYKIQVDDLETGVYFYEIIGDEKIIGNGKFIKL